MVLADTLSRAYLSEDENSSCINMLQEVPGSEVWTLGECIKEVSPRSYLVRVGDRQYRRNRRQLLHTGERLLEDRWEDETQSEDLCATEDTDEEERRELLRRVKSKTGLWDPRPRQPTGHPLHMPRCVVPPG